MRANTLQRKLYSALVTTLCVISIVYGDTQIVYYMSDMLNWQTTIPNITKN